MSCTKKFYAVIAIILAILLLMSAFVFIVDPANYYRYNENNIIFTRHSLPGIVNHYPHTTEFIGTSMFKNYDMNLYNKLHPNENAIKVTAGSMSFEECLMILESPRKSNVDTYVIDMLDFFTHDIDKSNISEDKYQIHLFNDTIADDYKYLLGYETWLSLIPINLGSNLLNKLGKMDLSKKTDLNLAVTYTTNTNTTAEDRKLELKDVERDYDMNYPIEKIKDNINYFVEEVIRLTDDNDKIIFVYPPVSVLYWNALDKQGAVDIILETKNLFVSKCSQYKNIRVMDFQSIDEITDLSKYMDTLHNNMELQNKTLLELDKDNYLLTTENVDSYNAKLKDMLHTYQKENASWLYN